MNGPIWTGWILVVILAVLSITLLMGKGSFLIAGFNTMGKEEKGRFNEERLCRVIGGGLGIITVMVGTSLYYKFQFPVPVLDLMMPWGLLAVIVLMLILSNTVCRKK